MREGGLLCLLATMLAAVLLSPAWAGDALQAGYDCRHSSYTSETLTHPLSLAWKFSQPPDPAGTSPVYAENTVFCALGSTLFSLNPDTGGANWGTKVESPINGSPCYHLGKIIFGTDNGYVYALRTPDGKVAWYARVGSAVRAAPCLVGDTIYCATTDARVAALDANTGKPRWITTLKEAVYSSPAVVDQVLAVAAVNRAVYGLDTATGRLKWTYQIPGSGGAYADVVANDRQFFVLADKLLVALGARGIPLWKLQFSAAPPAAPALDRGILYLPGDEGDLYAIEAQTGKIIWHRALGMYVSCGITISGNLFFAGSDAGLVRAYDLQTCQPLWQYLTWHPLLVKASSKADDYVPVVPPVVAGGALYVVTGAGELMKLCPDAFDASPPEALEFTPAEGSPVKSKLPVEFSVRIYDEGSGVDTSSIRLELDGEPLPAEFEPVRNEVSFTKDTPAGTALTDGWHTVTVRAKDMRGNELVRSWKFLADAAYTPPADTTKKATAATTLGRRPGSALGGSRFGTYGRAGGSSRIRRGVL